MKDSNKNNLRTLGETLKDGLITLDDVKKYFHYKPEIIKFFDQFIGSVKYSDLVSANENCTGVAIEHKAIDDIYNMFCCYVNDENKIVFAEYKKYVYNVNGEIDTVIDTRTDYLETLSFKDGKVERAIISNNAKPDDFHYDVKKRYSYVYKNGQIASIKSYSNDVITTTIYDEKLNGIEEISDYVSCHESYVTRHMFDELGNEVSYYVLKKEGPDRDPQVVDSKWAIQGEKCRIWENDGTTAKYADTKNSKIINIDYMYGLRETIEVIDGVFCVKHNGKVKLQLPVGKFK